MKARGLFSRRAFAAACSVLVLAAGLSPWAGPVAGTALCGVERSAPKSSPGSAGTPAEGGWIAAPGRIEPVSEEMRLGFDIAGKLVEVLVEEGDAVTRHQVLARLSADDLKSQVEAAEALLAAREAQLEKVLAGARSMERREAGASLSEAEAVLRQARVEHRRRVELLSKEVLSKEEADRAEREYLVSRERAEQARQRFHLVDDPARQEDIKKAWAEVHEARAKLEQARAYAAKAEIRSPIDGVVLRKHRRAGEMVSVSFDTPVLTVGDIGGLNARADVDEKDVARVGVGQRAYMVADAFGERRFWGTVIRVAKILGRKNIRTDDPAEKNDTRILEVVIALDEAGQIPVGLRMDVFILTGETGDAGGASKNKTADGK